MALDQNRKGISLVQPNQVHQLVIGQASLVRLAGEGSVKLEVRPASQFEPEYQTGAAAPAAAAAARTAANLVFHSFSQSSASA